MKNVPSLCPRPRPRPENSKASDIRLKMMKQGTALQSTVNLGLLLQYHTCPTCLYMLHYACVHADHARKLA